MAGSPQPDGGRHAEWLETGTGRTRNPRRPLLVAAAVLLALVVVVTVVGLTRRTPATTPRPMTDATSATTDPGRVPGSVVGTPTPTRAPVTSSNPSQITLGHPLFDTVAGWQIVGYNAQGVVRIDPARGLVISTPVPTIPTDAPVTIATAAGYAVIRPIDDVSGYLVADGQPARVLSGVLQDARAIVPSGDGRYVWAMTDGRTGTDNPVRVRQVGADGRSTGVELPIPVGGGYAIASDSAGRVIIDGTGGAYLATPGRLAKITSGQLVAVGPTRMLANECDEIATCRAVVIERSTGQRRLIFDAPLPAQPGEVGVVSPDGRWAMTTSPRDDGVSDVVLTDLDRGGQRTLTVKINGLGLQDHAWSPDGRWLILTDQTSLYAVDPSTGEALPLPEVPAPLTSLVIRQVG